MLQRFVRWLGGAETQVAAVTPPPAPAQGDASALVAESLRALREEVGRIRDEMAQIHLDWASTLDKMKKWANRQAAREKAAYDSAMAATEAQPGSTSSAPPHSNEVRLMSKSELRQLAALQRNGGQR